MTDPEEPRRHPSTIGGAFYLVVLAAMATGIVITVAGHWRTGVNWVGGSMIAAALLRLVLRRRDAGMLAVRNRFLDCAVLLVLGGSLCFLAATVPDRPFP